MMSDISSNELMEAMLEQQLSGNEIKMIIAYVKLGGWKAGAEVFLPEAKRIEWGISHATATRTRNSLKEKGWLRTTGNKSRYGCDKYSVHIPKATQNESGRSLKMSSEVPHFDPSGPSKRSLEVIKEVPKEVTKISNEESVLDGQASAGATAFLNDEELEVKEDQETTGPPAPSNVSYEEDSPAFLNVPVDTGVTQNEAPKDEIEEFLRMRAHWKKKDAERAAKAKEPVIIAGIEW